MRKLKSAGLLVFALLLALSASGQETQWFLLPEPRYMRPDFMLPIEGTKNTVFTPVLIKGEDVSYLKKETLERLGLDMDSIRRVARRSASEALSQLTPRIIRDPRGVAVFAILEADRPFVAATVLAPDFAGKFAEIFGPDLLVAIPNRFRVYVYPALASRFADTADYVLSDNEISAYPVSKEVFRITPDGIEAIGTFEER